MEIVFIFHCVELHEEQNIFRDLFKGRILDPSLTFDVLLAKPQILSLIYTMTSHSFSKHREIIMPWIYFKTQRLWGIQQESIWHEKNPWICLCMFLRSCTRETLPLYCTKRKAYKQWPNSSSLFCLIYGIRTTLKAYADFLMVLWSTLTFHICCVNITGLCTHGYLPAHFWGILTINDYSNASSHTKSLLL